MEQNKGIDFLNNLGKGIVKIGTLTPVFKVLFSTKGIVITAIVIHSLLMFNYIPKIFSEPPLITFFAPRDVAKAMYSMLKLFQYIFDIAVLVVVFKMVKQYLRNNAITALDLAKKQGILSESEHGNKVSKLHHAEILENIRDLEKAGLYDSEKREEIESMLSEHYEHKKKMFAIEKAYEDGALSDEEYKEKINNKNI